jgi:alpha-D-xyloside xylohydrolase
MFEGVIENGNGTLILSFSLPGPHFLPQQTMLTRLRVSGCGAVRVTRTLRSAFLDAESLTVTDKSTGTIALTEEEDALIADCGSIIARIGKKEGGITFTDASGKVVFREKEKRPCVLEEKPVIVNRFDTTGDITYTQSIDGVRASVGSYESFEDRKAYEAKLSFEFDADEALYGLGSHEEGYGNLRGHVRELYQHNLKAVVPMLVSTSGWGMLFDIGCLAVFHDDVEGSYMWLDCVDEADYYFMHGGYANVMKQYMALTGAAPLMPKYAFGYVQSKEKYNSGDELISIVKEYRKRNVPLDVIVQDWCSWPEGQWGWKHFDTSRFPDPKALTDELHSLGAKMMISIWPSMQGDQNENRKEMLQKGLMLGNRTIYNAFLPEARKVYWKQANEGLFSYGIDAWWCDCSEPFESDWKGAIRPEPIVRARINTDEAKKYIDPALISLYSLQHSKGIYEGQRETTAEKRVVNLTRSCWAGQHRYGTVTWSGDVYSSWEVLKRQIPEGLNFISAGENYWSTDAGGFFPMDFGGAWFGCGEFSEGVKDLGYRELYVRWLQFAAFLPMMRSHGTGTPREIWQFGEKGTVWYDAIEKAIRMRSALVPYLYSLAAEYTFNAMPMLTPPALSFPKDKALRGDDSQMLLGGSVLIKPVTRYMEYAPGSAKVDHPDYSETVLLPAGSKWYNMLTGELTDGGQRVSVEARVDSIPVFIKAGSILVTGLVRQYVSENESAPAEITVFAGGDCAFTYYNDAGDGYGYENGEYLRLSIRWNESTRTLTVGHGEGAWAEDGREIPFVVSVYGKEKRGIVWNGKEASIIL